MNSQKGFLNKTLSIGNSKNQDTTSIKNFLNEVLTYARELNKDSYCEISHYSSNSFLVMIEEFKNGVFISDDPYESLLEYHLSIINNKKLDVYNYFLNPGNFLEMKMNETFDFIFSSFGLSYEKLYSILPDIIGLLKVDGIIAIEIPLYWFFRTELSNLENDILDYSMKNDKRWIFSEPIEPVVKENGAQIVVLKKLENKKVLNRLELSYISSLQKLHKAHIENNIAILEVAGIPEDNLEIGKAILIIRKNKKTITKDNLFNV